MKVIEEKLLFVLVGVFFLVGILLRGQETYSGNFLFLLDQGRDMMAVKGIVFDHNPTLIGPNTSLQGVYQGPLWYYFLAIPTFMFNGDPWGGVLLMFLISMGVLTISFIWMKWLFGIAAAVTTVFLLAISPQAIAAATFAWNPHPMWLLLCLFIFLFFGLLRGKKYYHVFVWPVIALMFHFEAALGAFIAVSAIVYLIIFQRRMLKTLAFIKGLIIAGVFFIPHLLFELRHNFLMTNSFLQLFSGKSQGLRVAGEQNPYLLTLKDHFDAFVINFQGTFFHEVLLDNIPVVFFGFFLFFVIFGKKLKLLDDAEYSFLRFIAQFVLIVFLLLFLYPFPIRAWFLTGFEMFYLLGMGVVLSKLFIFRVGKLILLLFLVCNIVLLTPKIYKLYAEPDYGGIAKVKGKADAIAKIYKDAQGKKFNLLIFSPPVYTDPFDYLIWLQSRKSDQPIPGKEKKGTFYLLIEPDSGKPWSYKGWLETVVKTGKVIYTKELPSGLIIQKREESP